MITIRTQMHDSELNRTYYSEIPLAFNHTGSTKSIRDTVAENLDFQRGVILDDWASDRPAEKKD